MKRIFCILLVLFLLCGCDGTKKGGTNSGQNESKSGEISLLYSFGDGFDPYTAKTELNRRLCTLLYDPLIKTDNDFKPVFCLAKNASIEGNICAVTLRDAVFSDGSAITASDVIFSYNLAKKSEWGGFSPYLYEVLSAVEIDSKTVAFNLSRNDPYILNLLTFPIIKANTTNMSDSDGVAIPPVGSGRFTVSGETFVKNEKHYEKGGSVKKIRLINAPDKESISHYVEVGATDLYYTDATGDIARMSGKRSEVDINRFVYIGINYSYGQLSTREMRYALASAIDREATVSGAYYSNAYVATGFFNPNFADTKPTGTLKSKSDTQITVENLKKLGYNKLNGDGYYENDSGNHPAFTLLVNEDNASRVRAAELIAAQCRSAGIEITVIKRSYEQYVSLMASGNFQLYLGEISVLPNMDLSPLCVAGGSAAYGVNGASETQGSVAAAVNGYFSGNLAITDLAGVYLTEMPQIPVLYRKGLLFYNSRLKGDVSASLCDTYYSVDNFKF